MCLREFYPGASSAPGFRPRPNRTSEEKSSPKAVPYASNSPGAVRGRGAAQRCDSRSVGPGRNKAQSCVSEGTTLAPASESGGFARSASACMSVSPPPSTFDVGAGGAEPSGSWTPEAAGVDVWTAGVGTCGPLAPRAAVVGKCGSGVRWAAEVGTFGPRACLSPLWLHRSQPSPCGGSVADLAAPRFSRRTAENAPPFLLLPLGRPCANPPSMH